MHRLFRRGIPAPLVAATRSGACQVGDATGACGLDGQMCITCEVSGEVCTGGDCVCPSHVICAAGGCCPHEDDVCDGDDHCCTPNDPCTGGACGMTADNCGQNIDCGSCPPRILRFGASPDNINRGYSETAELFWITTTATDCSIDNGVGSVPCYGSVSVGLNEATTYTLSASGPGGGPVTAQASVTVEFCHAVNPSSSGCPGSFTLPERANLRHELGARQSRLRSLLRRAATAGAGIHMDIGIGLMAVGH